jgi:glycosyltransferase involved in cell wall biosynthesis
MLMSDALTFSSEKDPKITVITACLNASRTIEQTIRSVLDQEYPNLEYIIIDGGSEDGTLDIVEKYRERISIFVSEPDNGIYDAFNKGIRLATGDLIGILNADDFYAPWAFKRAAEAYESRHDCDVFFGKLVVIDEETKRWKVYSLGAPEDLVDHVSVPHPAVFAPRKTYERWGSFDDSYKIAGDWDFLLRLYTGEASFCPVDDVFTAFRVSGVSSLLSSRQLMENRLVYLKYLDRSAALKKISKMYLKYYGRLFMKISHTYEIYAKFRDSRILSVEREGEYSNENADSVWSILQEK